MNRIYSVGQVNRYIKGLFQQDYLLRRISVRGEVSNCKYHSSGHIYFTLKDGEGLLSCVMFASARKGMTFRMKDGDTVVVTGTVDIYERDGRYQLYARQITAEGAGALYERYLALKEKLEKEGLFDRERKKPIPKHPECIGVVTAPTGAAVRDIQNICHRRNPAVQLILFPAQVQGEGAAESVAAGIRMLDALGVDVIIVGRGGGSIEDLWAFNEELVARTIADCDTPVISAVGHETDTTIADFAADLRAPTPSAAAELAVLDLQQLLQDLQRRRQRLQYAMQLQIDGKRSAVRQYTERWKYLSPEHRIALQRQRLSHLRERILFHSPEGRIREHRQYLADLGLRLEEREKRVLQNKRHQLQLRIGRLKGLSPLERLNQGYAYLEDEEGRQVRSAGQTKVGQYLTVRLRDGSLRTEIREISLQE